MPAVWYFAGIIPGEYKNNLDYIKDILMTVNTKYMYDLRAKEGILNGLKKYYMPPVLMSILLTGIIPKTFRRFK